MNDEVEMDSNSITPSCSFDGQKSSDHREIDSG